MVNIKHIYSLFIFISAHQCNQWFDFLCLTACFRCDTLFEHPLIRPHLKRVSNGGSQFTVQGLVLLKSSNFIMFSTVNPERLRLGKLGTTVRKYLFEQPLFIDFMVKYE